MTDPDILSLLQEAEDTLKESNPYIYTLPITITCAYCKTQFKGTIKGAKKWWDKDMQFYYPTYYCPNCPHIQSKEEWLKEVLGITFEKVVERDLKNLFKI